VERLGGFAAAVLIWCGLVRMNRMTGPMSLIEPIIVSRNLIV
jgi:hypothetical protein